MRIGIMDSGIGGISVLHEALRYLPNEDYLYFADTSNVPYGEKTRAEVQRLVCGAVDFIIRQGVKAVLVACNTATYAAIENIRAKYSIPIIGMEPAVKPAVEKSRSNSNKRVLVTATPMTIKEEKLHNLIARSDSEDIVDLLPLPGLVRFAESYDFSERSVLPYLRQQLSDFDPNNYEAVVLGCTHFIFFKDMFKKLFPPDVDIIDGNFGTVRNLKRILADKNLLDGGAGEVVYYNSGVRVSDKAALAGYKMLLDRLDDIILVH
jgi:glutamate racemase